MALARFRSLFIHVAQRLQHLTAWFREVRGHFYKLPPSLRQTVDQQNPGAVGELGRVARQRSTHLPGPGKIRGAVWEHIAQIFARVLATGEVQGDPAPWLCGHDAGGEHTGAVVGWLARHAQHAHAGVVVVQHFALRGLPNQFVARRLDEFRLVSHCVEAGSGRPSAGSSFSKR